MRRSLVFLAVVVIVTAMAAPSLAIIYEPPGINPPSTYADNELIVGFTDGYISEAMKPVFEADIAAIVAENPRYTGFTVEYGYADRYALVILETAGNQPEDGHGRSFKHMDGPDSGGCRSAALCGLRVLQLHRLSALG